MIWWNFGNISHWSLGTQDESGECVTITTVKYAPEEQCEMQYTEISSNHSKDNLPLCMIQL